MPPRGPRGPRGPRRGYGGTIGGMPVSRSGRIMVNGHVVNPFASPAGGYVHSPANGPVDAYATYTENLKDKMRFAIKRNGPLKGTLIGIRHILTNGLHSAIFNRKIELADQELAAERITERQCKSRKMSAAAEYFGYLKKIGVYDDAYVQAEMQYYASKIGYDFGPAPGGPTR